MDNKANSVAAPGGSAEFFLSRLESLRGLAALMVAVSHCLLAFKLSHTETIISKFLALLFNGRAAVSMFFVMSGYVLGLSLLRNKHTDGLNVTAFLLRRIFRIIPALVATTLVFAAFIPANWNLDSRNERITDWLLGSLPRKPGAGELLQNITLFSHSINGATWSLQVEILGSLLLLVVHIVHRRNSWPGTFALTSCLLGVAAVSRPHEHPWFHLFLFPIGYSLCHLRESVIRSLFKGGAGVLILIGSSACWLSARVIHFSEPFSFSIEGVGAAGVLAAIVWFPRARLFTFLDWTLVRFLGRVSYSFYLVHPIVMIFVINFFISWIELQGLASGGLVASIQLSIVTVLIALPVSWGCFSGIESPTNKYGRALAKICETLSRNRKAKS